MKIRQILILSLLLCLSPMYAKVPTAQKISFVQVGNTRVLIRQFQHGVGKQFVHLHQNETTALKAAHASISAYGGSILTLRHPGGGRNVIFYLKHRRYEFDPNRIFTDTGIRKTLTQYSQYHPEAHREVKKLADKIKALLPRGKIIAVHNNQTYSFRDYFPGHNLASEAQALHVADHRKYRNFYLVTQSNDYHRLKKLKFNEVLQARHAEDDGSLSVYLAHRDYVNVEAGYSQLAAQIKMLRHA